jgi:hypothetical protein
LEFEVIIVIIWKNARSFSSISSKIASSLEAKVKLSLLEEETPLSF